MLVPPDPLRRFVSKEQIKAILGANNVDNDHGFNFVDPQQNEASNGRPPTTRGIRRRRRASASSPSTPTRRAASSAPFGPQPTGSSNGNLDHPQFLWLRDELNKAENQGKLIVIFGHHPVRTMDSAVPDEATGDVHGRSSTATATLPSTTPTPAAIPTRASRSPCTSGTRSRPGARKQRQTFTELLANHPNVIAFVAGHTHEHQLLPLRNPAYGNPATPTQNARFCGEPDHLWWEINTSAVADWPHQHRLIEVMDNRDDTLSIFGTVLDHASPGDRPGSGERLELHRPPARLDRPDLRLQRPPERPAER